MSDQAATMRAWRVHEYGRPLDVLQLEQVPIPTVGPGEILVKVQAIPLNLNDLERITGGNMMARPEFPYSPGMEVFGVVDAAGEGAEHLLGELVAATTKQAHGGFAEYAVCGTAAAFSVPADLPMPGAAALYFPFHLAWLGLFDRGELAAGETVLIHAAAGGSGSAAIQLAKHVGARVIASVGDDAKGDLCRSLGADVVVNYRTEDFAEVCLRETGGEGVDLVFDNVGEAVLEASLKSLRYNGRLVMMGFASNKVVADEPFYVPRRLALSNIKLCGVMLNYADDAMRGMLKSAMGWNVASSALGKRIMDDIVELVRAGKIAPVLGLVVDFEQLPTAITAMANRETSGRVVVTV